MSTRSITAILDEDGREIVVVYNQYDGYPSGYGLELAKFLSGFKVTNGISANKESKKIANGMECLAAQLVVNFKTDVGGVYLYTAKTRRMGDEYLYEVSLVNSKLMIKLFKSDLDTYPDLYSEIFLGSPEEFVLNFE